MKPQPVVKSTICSICDLPWEAHGDDPTVLDCIRLLKADTVRQVQAARLMRPRPLPYWHPFTPCSPAPWPNPPTPIVGPIWIGTPNITCGSEINQTACRPDPSTILLNAPNVVEECSSSSWNLASPFGI